MLSLPSPASAPPSARAAMDPCAAVLGALVSGALQPGDVAGLPVPVALVAALCGVRGGVRLPVAVAALREAGFTSEADGLPAAAQGRVRRPRAIEAVEAMRARCAGEVARDEREEDGQAGDGERGAEGVGGDPPGAPGMGASGDSEGSRGGADPEVRAGAGDHPGGEDRGALRGPCPPERAGELASVEAAPTPADALEVRAWRFPVALVPYSPAPDPKLPAFVAVAREAWAKPRNVVHGNPGRPCYPAGSRPRAAYARNGIG